MKTKERYSQVKENRETLFSIGLLLKKVFQAGREMIPEGNVELEE